MDWKAFEDTVRDACYQFRRQTDYGSNPPVLPRGRNIITPTHIDAFMVSDDLLAEVCTGTGMSRQNICGVSVFDLQLNSISDKSELFQDGPGVGRRILDHLLSLGDDEDEDDEEE